MKELINILRSGIALTKLVDPRAYLVFVPMLILTSTLSNARWDDPVGLGIWFSANLVAMAITFLLLSVAKQQLEKLDTPIHAGALTIFATGFAIGFVKTVFTLVPAQIMLGQNLNALDILLRSLFVAPLALTLVPVVVWISVARERYLANRDAVIALRIANAGNSSDQGGATVRVQQELVAKIADEITRVRNKLFGAESFAPLVEQARELRNLADYTVRPISHQIWSEQSKRVNDFSLRQLAILGIKSTPFAPLIFVLIIAPGLLFWAYGYLGPESIATKAIPALALIFLAQFAVSKWESNHFGGWLRFAVGLGLPALFGTLAIYHDIIRVDPVMVLTLFLTLAFWFISTGILIAILRAGIRARSDLDRELTQIFGEGSLESASLTSLSRFESRRIAQALHSNVQNKLLSAAMRLEGEDALSRDELDAQLSLLESTVREIGTAAPASSAKSIGESIEIVKSDWQGFLEISAAGDLDSIPSLGNEIIQQLLTEAIGNAKRHGGANQVRIGVTKEDSGLRLEISDNGKQEKKGTAGMGFALFSSISIERFSFVASDEGSTLSLLLRA